MKSITERRAEFGATLRKLRKRNNLSQRDLQGKSGITYSLISSFENGDRAIGPSVAARLATALGLENEEKDRFLISAASTRKRNCLAEYARDLAPELLNFLPRVLSSAGVDLQKISTCEAWWSNSATTLATSPCTVKETETTNIPSETIVVHSDGRKFLCSLRITPAT